MNKFFEQAREPWSSCTHLIGAGLSIFGTLFLLASYFANGGQNYYTLLSVVVFGLSLVALYTSSGIYHYFNGSPEALKRLRKLDHAMIYVLIAGSYTPIIASFMNTHKATIFLCVIWGIALLGIIIKLCWLDAPRWLYTSLYVIMGWSIVFDIKALLAIPTGCITFVAAGGIAYTIGAVIYIIKKPNITKGFGFHEIFHIFVMLGSALHFIGIALYAL